MGESEVAEEILCYVAGSEGDLATRGCRLESGLNIPASREVLRLWAQVSVCGRGCQRAG